MIPGQNLFLKKRDKRRRERWLQLALDPHKHSKVARLVPQSASNTIPRPKLQEFETRVAGLVPDEDLRSWAWVGFGFLHVAVRPSSFHAASHTTLRLLRFHDYRVAAGCWSPL